MGQPTLVFACATCSIFNMFLPEIKRVSLYALLAEEEGFHPFAPMMKPWFLIPVMPGTIMVWRPA